MFPTAFSMSVRELVETHFPAAIDNAHATKPVSVANRVEYLSSLATATPMGMEAIDKTPSFAPKTTALIQLLLWM